MNVCDAIAKLGGVRATAAALGVTERSVGAWKRKGRVPRAAMAVKLSELSGVPVADLAKAH